LQPKFFYGPTPKNAEKCHFFADFVNFGFPSNVQLFDGAGNPANFFDNHFCDFSELVWRTETFKVPKFAAKKLQTFIFYASMPKIAKKCRLLPIFCKKIDGAGNPVPYDYPDPPNAEWTLFFELSNDVLRSLMTSNDVLQHLMTFYDV